MFHPWISCRKLFSWGNSLFCVQIQFEFFYGSVLKCLQNLIHFWPFFYVSLQINYKVLTASVLSYNFSKQYDTRGACFVHWFSFDIFFLFLKFVYDFSCLYCLKRQLVCIWTDFFCFVLLYVVEVRWSKNLPSGLDLIGARVNCLSSWDLILLRSACLFRKMLRVQTKCRKNCS